MTVVVPSMSDRGWLLGPSEKADQLLAWFFATDVAQSYLYAGNLTSVQDLLEKYGHDEYQLATAMQDRLDAYLSPHFDQVVVSVSSDGATNPSNKATLTISVSIMANGQVYSITSLVGEVNSKFQRITNYINTGVLSAD